METTFFRTGGFSIEKTYKGHSPEPPTLVVKWMETTFFSDSTQTLTHRHTHMQWRTQSMGNTFYRDTADSSASRPLRMSSKTQGNPGFLSSSAPLVSKEAFLHCDNTYKRDLIHTKKTYSYWHTWGLHECQEGPNTYTRDLIHTEETYCYWHTENQGFRTSPPADKRRGCQRTYAP